MRCSKSSFKREIYSATVYLRKQEKFSNNLTLIPKATKERRMNKTQSQQKERNQRAEINRDYKNIENINETKSWFFEKTHKNC